MWLREAWILNLGASPPEGRTELGVLSEKGSKVVLQAFEWTGQSWSLSAFEEPKARRKASAGVRRDEKSGGGRGTPARPRCGILQLAGIDGGVIGVENSKCHLNQAPRVLVAPAVSGLRFA